MWTLYLAVGECARAAVIGRRASGGGAKFTPTASIAALAALMSVPRDNARSATSSSPACARESFGLHGANAQH